MQHHMSEVPRRPLAVLIPFLIGKMDVKEKLSFQLSFSRNNDVGVILWNWNHISICQINLSALKTSNMCHPVKKIWCWWWGWLEDNFWWWLPYNDQSVISSWSDNNNDNDQLWFWGKQDGDVLVKKRDMSQSVNVIKGVIDSWTLVFHILCVL